MYLTLPELGILGTGVLLGVALTLTGIMVGGWVREALRREWPAP